MEKHIVLVSDSFPFKKEIYVMGLLKAVLSLYEKH